MTHIETLDLVNELLRGASAKGAFCLGAVCSIAWESGTEPAEGVMRAAVQMTRVKDAVELSLYHQTGRIGHS